MREILAKAMDPEIQARIGEVVRDPYEAQDPVWRELIWGADVLLDGQSMIVLDGGSIPHEKDLSVPRRLADADHQRGGKPRTCFWPSSVSSRARSSDARRT